MSHRIGLVLTLYILCIPYEVAATEGADLYHEYCSVCHGDKGDGKSRAAQSLSPPPKDFSSPAAAGELSRDRMIQSVSEGRPGTAMTAWKHQLTSEQIVQIVDYIRSEFMLGAAQSEFSQGQLVYAEYCSVCHGDRGNGISRAANSLNPPPRNFTSLESAQILTRERMIFSVSYGRPNTAMTAWGTQLSKAQIEDVVDFIRLKFMQRIASQDNPSATSNLNKGIAINIDAPMPHNLSGDYTWGNAFYDANCATCHGFSGDGRGPRAYFIFPKPRDFREPAAKQKFNRPELFKAISTGSLGTEMPAWNKVLTNQEIANVAEYVFRAFILQD